MHKTRHCAPVSRLRGGHTAATNFTVKLEATTEIIDRLLLIPRQAQWKVVPDPGTSTDTDTDFDTDGFSDTEL
ncbi:MAG: hypothetical protein ACLFTT_15810 [Candidatus Hydrogenedentota bacterium]